VQNRRVAGFWEELYRRAGRWYLYAYFGLVLVLGLATTFATAMVGSRYLGVSGWSSWRGVLVLETGVLVVAGWLLFAWQRSDRALFAWVRGERGHEVAHHVWSTAPGTPTRTLLMLAWRTVVVMVPTALLAFALSLTLTALQVAVIVVGASAAIAYVVGAHHLLLELALRPVLRDVATALPPQLEVEHGTIPLAARLFLSLFALSAFVGTVIGGFETPFGSGAGRLLRDYFIVGGVGATFSFVLAGSLAATVLAPTADLLRATQRVADGDFSTGVSVLAANEHATLARGFNQMVRGLQQREALRVAFGSYVDPTVAERVIAHGEIVEGTELEVTVMFVDIRSFTTLADTSTPTEVVAYLNQFFGLVLPLVRKHHGHPNKLLGDGLLAVFGAPESLDAHADRALGAACDVAQAVEARYGGQVRVGIGLNSGTVIAGTIGASGKLDYTLIGDTVNVASRVEQLTKETGDVLLITEATRRLLNGSDVALEVRGAHRLKGKQREVEVYAVIPQGAPSRETSASLE